MRRRWKLVGHHASGWNLLLTVAVVGALLSFTPRAVAPAARSAGALSLTSRSEITSARPASPPLLGPGPGARGQTSSLPPRWIEICAGGATSSYRCDPQPPDLVGAAIAFNSKQGEALEFGGASPSTHAGTNSTYAYSDSSDLGLIWSNLTPTGTVPGARSNASMAYDSTDGYSLLFGGWSSAGSTIDHDTWYWNPDTEGWIPVRTPTALLGRTGACLFNVPAGADHPGYVLLFGGQSIASLKADAFPTSTWTYSGGLWTNVTATAGTPPAGRTMAGCDYDPSDDYGVLFGGVGAGGTLMNDTWAWNANLSEWAPLLASGAAVAPSARFGSEFAYDSYDSRIVLYSGARGTPADPDPLSGDTWRFSAGHWSNATESTGYETMPSFGDYGGAATDTPFGYALFVGGATSDEVFENGTWGFGEFMLGSLTATTNELVLGQSLTIFANVSGGTGSNWTTSYSSLPTGCTSSNLTVLTCTPSEVGSYSFGAELVDPSGATNATDAVPLVVDPAARVAGSISNGSTIDEPPADFLGADYWFNQSAPASVLAERVGATGATLQRFYGNWDIDNVSAGLTYDSNGSASAAVPYNLSTYASLCADLGPQCHPTIAVSAETNDSGMMVANLRYDLHYLPDPVYLEIGTEVNNWNHFDIPFTDWRSYDNVAPTGLEYALEVRKNAPLLQALAPEAKVQVQLSAFYGHFPSRVLWFAQNLSKFDCGTVATITLDFYPNNRASIYDTPQILMRNVSTVTQALASLRAAIAEGNASCTSISVGISENNVAGGSTTQFGTLDGPWSPSYDAAELIQSLQDRASMYAYWSFIEEPSYGMGKGATFSMINPYTAATDFAYPLFEAVKEFNLASVSWANLSTPMRGVYSIASPDPAGGREVLVANTNTTVTLDLSTGGLVPSGEGLVVYSAVYGQPSMEATGFPSGSLPDSLAISPGSVVLLAPGNVTSTTIPLSTELVVVGIVVGAVGLTAAFFAANNRRGAKKAGP